MTTKNSDLMRETFIKELFAWAEARGEDVGMDTSGSFNFPIVAPDGEEGAAIIKVIIPKTDADIYEARAQYQDKLKGKAERKKKHEDKVAKAKAKKKA